LRRALYQRVRQAELLGQEAIYAAGRLAARHLLHVIIRQRKNRINRLDVAQLEQLDFLDLLVVLVLREERFIGIHELQEVDIEGELPARVNR